MKTLILIATLSGLGLASRAAFWKVYAIGHSDGYAQAIEDSNDGGFDLTEAK